MLVSFILGLAMTSMFAVVCIDGGPLKGGIHVAFSSLMSKSNSYGLNQIVRYDIILTNDCEGYSSETGVFTAPVPGTYLFTWSVSTVNAGIDVVVGLAVNGEYKGQAFSSDSGVDMGSQTLILKLDLLDRVWIAVQRGAKIFSNPTRNWSYPSFSGYLLYM